jgi:ubiquinone/menaquinone biosynthesis C-methylase UbiE
MAVTGSAASYFYSTGPGKRSTWAEVLDGLDLRGDEHVLDVGCGRGAVLMLAAHRVPKGKAVGVDLWRRRDQSGNSHAATERNAALEGVRDRVEVLDGDARDLPCPSGLFDLVVSNLTIHNIRHVDERKKALSEAVRVLRRGGRLRIVDFNADRYAEPLRDAGCVDVQVRRLDWRMWFGVPGLAALVEARTPAD